MHNNVKNNFRTPLTPLHRGGLGGLHKCRLKGIYSRGLEVLAFSLIELSIVLIIIGLLVAGVTGGKSLIESAKQRAFINELNDWKQAVYTFYAARGRLPGDIKNKGILGYGSPDSYSTNDYPAGTFAEPFDNVKINDHAAPFVEMYLEGISDFKPNVATLANNVYAGYYGNAPYSNVIKKCHYLFSVGGYDYLSNSRVPNVRKDMPYLQLYISDASGEAKKLSVIKLFKKTDEKIDDGIVNYGNVVATCGGVSGTAYGKTTYDQVLESDGAGSCGAFYYYVGF